MSWRRADDRVVYALCGCGVWWALGKVARAPTSGASGSRALGPVGDLDRLDQRVGSIGGVGLDRRPNGFAAEGDYLIDVAFPAAMLAVEIDASHTTGMPRLFSMTALDATP